MRFFSFRARCAFLVLWSLWIYGCGVGSLNTARRAFYDNRPEKALQTLTESKPVSGRDKLLLLMEKGTILHEMGEYDQSAGVLRKASELMEKQDVVNVGQQTAALVTSDWATEYKGEYCERLWVHTYAMMNYLLLSKYESALVEAKQTLKVFDRYGSPLSEDYFTRALVAHSYEILGELDDAYIEYKKLAADLPNNRDLNVKLFETARRLGFNDDAERYRDEISGYPPEKPDDYGELVLFAGMGKMSVKQASDIVIPPSIRISYPQYMDTPLPAADVTVLNTDVPLTGISIGTDLRSVAKQSLSARAREYITRQAARAAVKETISQTIDNEDAAALSILVRMVFFLLEEADTRGWETLPAFLKLMIIPLPPGKHHLKAVFLNEHGASVEETDLPVTISHPGARVYRSVRMTGK